MSDTPSPRHWETGKSRGPRARVRRPARSSVKTECRTSLAFGDIASGQRIVSSFRRCALRSRSTCHRGLERPAILRDGGSGRGGGERWVGRRPGAAAAAAPDGAPAPHPHGRRPLRLPPRLERPRGLEQFAHCGPHNLLRPWQRARADAQPAAARDGTPGLEQLRLHPRLGACAGGGRTRWTAPDLRLCSSLRLVAATARHRSVGARLS